MGPPASGKTTLAKQLCGASCEIVRLSRDEFGGALRELVPRVRKALQAGQSVILDNLFAILILPVTTRAWMKTVTQQIT